MIAALQAGNVVLMVQPPRGFGENPVAIYHDPDLPPSHHYLAAYHWIDAVFGADAVVHLGKHGNLEWLPGKTLGMSAACGSDAALGDLPLIYPFLVNDPGEGTQAKRRAHATLVDHLIPPMARAETYGDIARLEQLLDEHANIAALDPGKLPAIRQQIWTLMRAAKMDHDLGLVERPDEDSFDDMLLHVDGWLCEIKDVQIRDGLHILGEKPTGGTELDLVLAILRARQLFGGEQTVPGLRQALGLAEDGNDDRAAVDAAEAQARELVAALQKSGWDPHGCRTRSPTTPTWRPFCGSRPPRWCRGWRARRARSPRSCGRSTAGSSPPDRRARRCAASSTCCRPAATSTPSTPRRCRRGWRGKPVWRWLIRCWRATATTTATGRSRSGCRCGAPRPCAPRATTSPKCLRCWVSGRSGTTRRGGWSTWKPIPLAELGRPRIDVTVRISGFFRDAFPHVVTMLDDAVQLVAGLDEPAEDNYVRAHATGRPRRARRPTPLDDKDFRLQAGHLRGRACCS